MAKSWSQKKIRAKKNSKTTTKKPTKRSVSVFTLFCPEADVQISVLPCQNWRFLSFNFYLQLHIFHFSVFRVFCHVRFLFILWQSYTTTPLPVEGPRKLHRGFDPPSPKQEVRTRIQMPPVFSHSRREMALTKWVVQKDTPGIRPGFGWLVRDGVRIGFWLCAEIRSEIRPELGLSFNPKTIPVLKDNCVPNPIPKIKTGKNACKPPSGFPKRTGHPPPPVGGPLPFD